MAHWVAASLWGINTNNTIIQYTEIVVEDAPKQTRLHRAEMGSVANQLRTAKDSTVGSAAAVMLCRITRVEALSCN